MADEQQSGGLSRRDLLRAGAVVGVGATIGGVTAGEANAWYLNREDDLGSIEVGKFADLLVLDRDYFSVSDDDMRRTQPVLTVVGGTVVHTTGDV